MERKISKAKKRTTRPKKKTDSKNITGSEIVETDSKRQYHIDLAPDEVAPFILLVGDPARASVVKEFFDKDSVRVSRSNREFISFTGTYQSLPVTVISTGIGPSNIEITLIELSRIIDPSVIIRVGSCGALQPEIELGDPVISSGAVRLEDTSLRFVDESYPSFSHHEAILALIEASKNEKYHVGITAAASGFYGAQGREIPGFPISDPQIPEKLAKRNVLNFEMESSTLFTLSSIKGWRSGTICAVYASRPKGTFIKDENKLEAINKITRIALDACVSIKNMDLKKAKAKTNYYYPSLGF
ncbi:MAG: nucleoside phosphorylase [Candidatus Hodarchaeales archaeon]